VANEDAEVALFLRLVKSLSDAEQLILMGWLMKPAFVRARMAANLPAVSPATHLLVGTGQPQLTDREMQVLAKLADGNELAAIAQDMSLSESTVRNHLRNVAAKFAPKTEEPPAAARVDLRMLPVRLPEATYEELKRWAAEHEYPMSVIVRGLVERFLEQQRAA